MFAKKDCGVLVTPSYLQSSTAGPSHRWWKSFQWVSLNNPERHDFYSVRINFVQNRVTTSVIYWTHILLTQCNKYMTFSTCAEKSYAKWYYENIPFFFQHCLFLDRNKQTKENLCAQKITLEACGRYALSACRGKQLQLQHDFNPPGVSNAKLRWSTNKSILIDIGPYNGIAYMTTVHLLFLSTHLTHFLSLSIYLSISLSSSYYNIRPPDYHL